jgi:hypothetical protein
MSALPPLRERVNPSALFYACSRFVSTFPPRIARAAGRIDRIAGGAGRSPGGRTSSALACASTDSSELSCRSKAVTAAVGATRAHVVLARAVGAERSRPAGAPRGGTVGPAPASRGARAPGRPARRPWPRPGCRAGRSSASPSRPAISGLPGPHRDLVERALHARLAATRRRGRDRPPRRRRWSRSGRRPGQIEHGARGLGVSRAMGSMRALRPSASSIAAGRTCSTR